MLERISMYIPSDTNNATKSMNKELSEDRNEIMRILVAIVVMTIIFWFMLISSSVSCDADRLANVARL
jgi:hypothetical protein